MGAGARHGKAVRVLLALAALGPASAALSQSSAAPAEPPLRDLRTLVAAAETHYPALAQREAMVRAAEARRLEARISPFFASWRTDFGLTFAPEASGTPIFTEDSQLPLGNRFRPVYSVLAEGVVPLWTFGRLEAARDAADAGVRAAELDIARRRAQLRYDVRRAYFGLQLALDIEQMIGEGRGQLRRAIAVLDEALMNDEPDANPFDRYRLAAAAAEVDARGSEAQRLRRASEAVLRTLTGFEGIAPPLCPMEPIALEEADLPAFLADATTQRPEVGMLEAAEDARRAAVDNAVGTLSPDLAVVVRAGISRAYGITDVENPFVQDPGNRPQLAAALLMRWSLDVGGNTARLRRARAELEGTRAQVAEATLGLRLEVELAYEAYQDASRREAAWQEARRETRRWFIASAQGYDVGATEPKDLVDALRAYFEARFNHVEAVRAVNTAVAELERVVGRPLLPEDGWEPPCE
ncbi:MAG: TolC family protein [Myxococcota bacterium]